MKQNFYVVHKRVSYLFIGIVIGVFGLIGVYGIGKVASNRMEGNFYYLSKKNNDIHQGDFTIEELEKLEQFLEQQIESEQGGSHQEMEKDKSQSYEGQKEELINNQALKYTYSYETKVEVQANEKVHQDIHLVVTNSNYQAFYSLPMKSGSFLQDQFSYNKQVVIDEELAFSFFGSNQVIGLPLEIGDELFYIVGIVKSEEQPSLRRMYIHSKDYKDKANCKVESILFKAATDMEIQNRMFIEESLTLIGRDKKQYEILNIGLKSRNLKERWRLIGIWTGIMLSVLGVQVILQLGRNLLGNIKENLKIEYMNLYIKKHFKGLLIRGIGILIGGYLSVALIILFGREFTIEWLQQIIEIEATYCLPVWLMQLEKWNRISWGIGVIGSLGIVQCIVQLSGLYKSYISNKGK